MDISGEHAERQNSIDKIERECRTTSYRGDNLYDFPDMEAPRSSDKKNRCGLYYVVFLCISAVVVASVLIAGSVMKFGDSSEDATTQERTPNLKRSADSLSKISVANEISAPPPAPDNLAQVCSNDNVIGTENGAARCIELCQPGICCVVMAEEWIAGISYEGDNCAESHAAICVRYEPCRNLYNRLDENDLSLLEEFEESNIPPAPSNLAEICESDVASCTEACKPGSCCTDLSTDSCLDLFPQECVGYLPCDVLNPYDSEEVEAISVNDICTVDLIDTDEGRQKCEEVCKPAACCEDKENSCAETDFCEEYKACALLAIITLAN